MGISKATVRASPSTNVKRIGLPSSQNSIRTMFLFPFSFALQAFNKSRR